MKPEEIISILPYSKPFLFVDKIISLDENSITGEYTFRKDEFFYEGHFKNFPVTPGVILIETMAQIGVVCLGVYLIRDKIFSGKFPDIAFVSSQVDFLHPVFPEEKVIVFSQKIFFRFGKLKCEIQMKNSKDDLVAKGILIGMVKNYK